MDSIPTGTDSPQVTAVKAYYAKTESLFGYKYLMGGTKHFGFYDHDGSGIPFGPALRRMEGVLAETLGVESGMRVLDAGCGTGVVACEIVGRTGCYVDGIDILGFNLETAKVRAYDLGIEDRTSFSLMSYSDLQFPDNTFDAVYTVETLVHSDDPGQVLGEFSRVLKPGGRLVMLEYSRERPERMPSEANQAFEFVNRVAAMPAFQSVFYFGSLESMLNEHFVDVVAREITANMMPMLKAFRTLAYIPYRILKAIDKREKAVNAMSAVEFYRYRQFFRYEVFSALKPLRAAAAPTSPA